jgi:hypothetical protein
LAKIGGKLFSNNGSNTKDGGRGRRIEKGRDTETDQISGNKISK